MNYFIFNMLEHSKPEKVKELKRVFRCIKNIERDLA